VAIIATVLASSMILTTQLASGAPPAQSRERLVVRGSDRGDAPSPSVVADLRTVAADLGLPLAEATARFAWQNEFAAAVDIIRAKHPGTFAGARITGATGALGAQALVEFTGGIPVGVDRLLATVPVNVELLGGTPRSEKGARPSLRPPTAQPRRRPLASLVPNWPTAASSSSLSTA